MNLDFPRLIQELAVNLQQPLMEPVEDACRISWDEVDMHIYLHEEDGKELVIVTLDIGEIPNGQEEHICKLMLQGNYLWVASEYATLSLHPESQMIVLCDKERAEVVEIESFTQRVKALYQTAVYWQEIISVNGGDASVETNGAPVLNHDFGIKV
ncbi:type III secretion system chaperone [Microbulbifer sp. JMSA003]|uniref:type III secretion system chaperone n=1 Tax=unclassified Microbulbifer TaxID=2619833 RepID=UPI00403914A7